MEAVASRMIPLLGYGLMIGLLVLMSSDRKRISWSVLGWGAMLQLGLAAVMLLTPVGAKFFAGVNRVVLDLLAFTGEGTRFLVGEFGKGDIAQPLHCFLFLVLPTIVFFSSLMAVLYHLRVMEWVISGMAWVLRKTLRISAAEAMNAAANVFVGHTEAPLVIRPYLERLTPSELMAVMVSGFATMAGGVIVAYSVMLAPHLSDVAGHLLAASLMNAPMSLVAAKILFPETGTPETLSGARADRGERDANVVGAAARGAAEGAVLFINVAAMLLAFIALVALVNALVSGGLSWFGVERYGADGRPDALQWAGGWLFSPLAWLCGVEWQSAPEVGRLLAQKLILNEFVAYGDLTALLKGGSGLSVRDATIAVYALCGFANISSIAIQVGGIGSLAPGQKGNLVRFGVKAMVGGFLASCLSASAAALFL